MILVYLVLLCYIFFLLAVVSDRYFVASLDVIAKKWKLPDDVAGATLMAIGSSAPEFFTAVFALFKVGAEQVGAGTIVGSAIFNILVIVGMSSLVATAFLSWRPVIRDLLFYLFSILILLFTFQDGVISVYEAGIYIACYGLYILILAKWSTFFREKSGLQTVEEEIEEFGEREEKVGKQHFFFSPIVRYTNHFLSLLYPKGKNVTVKYWRTFFISIFMIVVLSWALVELAVRTAHTLGIPEVIIALTILAGGTSIPDLLSSLIVAKKGRGDMAVSNAVGSNIFDILICLGLPWFFYTLVLGKSIVVGTENLTASILLLFFTVVTLFFLLIAQKFRIGKKSGYVLLLFYAGYIGYSIYASVVPDAWRWGQLFR